MTAPTAEVGIFGGSGFYELGEGDDVVIDTPYGPTSAPVSIVEMEGRRVAFLARHGRHHEHAPARVPYRANVWAMRELGVTTILAPCTVGSLQPDLHPGALVVVDQLVDRTWGRADTYHDGPGVEHVTFADPYHEATRQALLAGGRAAGLDPVDGGTMVVINGPRFSTRAESRWFRAMGWHVVNMTGYPEAVLAAELAVPYASVALVTDHDAGVDGVAPVSMEQVLAVFHENLVKVRSLLSQAIRLVP